MNVREKREKDRDGEGESCDEKDWEDRGLNNCWTNQLPLQLVFTGIFLTQQGRGPLLYTADLPHIYISTYYDCMYLLGAVVMQAHIPKTQRK